jgi:hypothetical protein
VAALYADQAACDERRDDPKYDLEVLLGHMPSVGENARIGTKSARWR